MQLGQLAQMEPMEQTVQPELQATLAQQAPTVLMALQVQRVLLVQQEPTV